MNYAFIQHAKLPVSCQSAVMLMAQCVTVLSLCAVITVATVHKSARYLHCNQAGLTSRISFPFNREFGNSS